MFSRACEYAIRAVIYIATHENNNCAGIKEICKSIEAPEYFTAKILQNLSRMGLVNSVKGPNGGFYLKEGNDVYLIDIVRAIDGDKIFTGCGLGLHQCSEEKPCPIHDRFKGVRNELKRMMEETTVRKMAADLSNGHAFLRTYAAKGA